MMLGTKTTFWKHLGHLGGHLGAPKGGRAKFQLANNRPAGPGGGGEGKIPPHAMGEQGFGKTGC